jgi:hypothetical protein
MLQDRFGNVEERLVGEGFQLKPSIVVGEEFRIQKPEVRRRCPALRRRRLGDLTWKE